ncbi:MAG: glycosyltransferase [Ignavibacteriales bacterium]
MKILIITPRIPYPPYRGDILHVFNIAKTLALKHDVDIITQIAKKNQQPYVHELKKFNINTNVIHQSVFASFMNLLFAMLNKTPFQIAYFASKKMSTLISQQTKKKKYDLIYFHLIRSAQYLGSTENSNAIKVCDYTDAVSLYLERYVKFIRNPFRKIFFYLELNRLKKYEGVAKKFNTVFICSDEDKKYLESKIVNTDFQILRNGVDEKFFYPADTNYIKHRIIFSGNMPYYPNKDAVKYFAKDIFPKILGRYPDSKFFIVGQKPPTSIKKLNSKNIIVTGFVEDIKKEYLLSHVNVAPIRFGAGTLNKVIESLALGVPVVASGIVIKGLPKELHKYVIQADLTEEFADKISYVFENDSIRNEMMKEVIEIIPKLLGWKPIVDKFENYIITKNNL